MALNPFVVGQWVRGSRFYGRSAEIEEALEGPRSWIWLLGTRRVGKTSLLRQMELVAAEANPRRYFPLFWDFQGAASAEELHGTFREGLRDAEERLEEIGLGADSLQGKDLFESLGLLKRALRARALTPLLLCDEVEELIQINRNDPSLLRKLRRTLQTGDELRSVLASTIRLWALADMRGDTSPFLHGFAPPIPISRLSDEDARALIRQEKLPDSKRPAIGASAVETIRSRSDNHPYLMQLVAKRYLELEDLEEAIEQVAADQMVSYFFSVDFEMLSKVQREVLRVVAESSVASSDSILQRISTDPGELSSVLLSMEQLGYIRRNPERQFELTNFFFRRWFKERPDSRAPVSGVKALSAGDRTTSDESTAALPGRRPAFADRYVLLEELGRGAMGVVYKALDQLLGETIALKILKPEYCSDPEILERFRREILLARDIGHPNILKVYHMGEHEGRMYLSMKLIDGPTLASLIRLRGALPIDVILDVASKLTSALQAAHALQVVHRDIKPANILLDGRGEPYIVDFGLARLIDSPGMTHPGAFLGTPAYASPEQVEKRPADSRTDLYSLGVVLFEMATGQRPFTADTVPEILEKHRRVAPPDPRSLRADLPDRLREVILRCLAKRPENRFQSASEVLATLDAS